ncbi:uncharacterized protein FIESC28_06863 [Fusarium coffeatum]|uniref:Uncharacterized protein n=1 Tax=Fusarium coffeatum TaxID=231269 RepID=A0A366RHC9_9HYPO|nr:uncharacterized protein FIESC28_06863 [Fusarium coffeatum]RBR16561.1 hypothetical protein FIESC28_06863 [Fusarium coffeatum]
MTDHDQTPSPRRPSLFSLYTVPRLEAQKSAAVDEGKGRLETIFERHEEESSRRSSAPTPESMSPDEQMRDLTLDNDRSEEKMEIDQQEADNSMEVDNPVPSNSVTDQPWLSSMQIDIHERDLADEQKSVSHDAMDTSPDQHWQQ